MLVVGICIVDRRVTEVGQISLAGGGHDLELSHGVPITYSSHTSYPLHTLIKQE